MKTDSFSTIVGRIHKISGPLSCFRHADERTALFAKLEKLGKWECIPYIFHFVLDGSKQAATLAAETIHAIIEKTPKRHLPKLEEFVNRTSGSTWNYDADYPELRTSDVKTIEGFGEFSAALLGIASFDHNGHIREAATRALGALGDGRAIPFLLLRMNDWVAQVRAAATDALERRTNAGNALFFVDSIELVERLRECGRGDHGAFVARINELIRRPEVRPAVLEVLSKGHFLARRQAARVLLEDDAIDPLALCEYIRQAPDSMVYALVANEACRKYEDERLKAVYDIFKAGPFPQVRAALIDAIAGKDTGLLKDALWEGLVDPGGLVRATCRFYLKKAGVSREAIAGRYRELIRSGRPAAAVIQGLTETGVASDADLIAGCIDNERVSVASAAIRGLAQLAPEKYYSRCAPLVTSPRPAVSKAARDVIIKFVDWANPEELWRIYMGAEAVHVRRNLIRDFNSMRKWDRIGLLLGVLELGRPNEWNEAYGHVQDWLRVSNKSYAILPTASQTATIRQRLAALKKRQDDRMWSRIEMLLPK
ncbi:MAG: HEAT repeat domain-containing protein [Candidatus Sumerlaeia bacterium]